MGLLVRIVIGTASLGVADYLIPGIFFEPPAFTGEGQTDYLLALAIASVILGVLNAFVRPVLFMLSLPLTCLTLGLFIFVLNGLMLVILSWLPVGFRVDGLFSAIVGALIVGVVSFILNRLVPG